MIMYDCKKTFVMSQKKQFLTALTKHAHKINYILQKT